ncbi:hypothetical protein [Methanobacterium spitsbergense]|uniref:Uncharacterized protein n=1 Tax=Methanobacterium spitsbergense TaxID=2874285 RepID=A0A8T5UX80_9EURY|nr:hypothetical protein [Methanobacterium spitsbergense]MBZ2166516.1 hypothetical protein [Methanobacterium spitsbergense]
MSFKQEELEELEEQLVLLYRFVSQNNTLKKFYYEGVDIKPSFKDETGILTGLVNNEESEEILKSCIMEIEDAKQEKLNEFHEVLDSYDMEVLFKKYGMSGVEDVDKLDIKKLVGSL